MNLISPIKGLKSLTPIVISDHRIYVSQGFGSNPQIYAQFGLAGHNGLDIAAPLGTPIYAPHDGEVSYLHDLDSHGKLQGYGNYARITFDEDGFTWELTMGHQQIFEGTNRHVKQGDVIGYVNSTGFSTGNHCHFGIRKLIHGIVQDYNNGFKGSIDPVPFIKEEIMTNALIVKNGSEFGIYLPSTSEDGFITLLRNVGLPAPLKADGHLDWTQIHADKQLT